MSEDFQYEIRSLLHEILSKFSEHEKKDEGRHADLIGRDRDKERRIEKLESSNEETGRHQIAALRDANAFWSRNWPGLVVSILSLGVAVFAITHTGR